MFLPIVETKEKEKEEKRKKKREEKKEKWKKICAFKVISDAKKTSFHLSMKQGLFNFYYSKYLISRIKIFTSDGINQICENIV
jgi:predicted DNA binding CopG/RHH family protein